MLRAAREGIQEGLGIRFTGGSSPSSGFMALHAALHMCDKVTAYGFTIGVRTSLALPSCLPPSVPGLALPYCMPPGHLLTQQMDAASR